jgi:hypothetical protein
MSAGRLDLHIEQGASFERTFTITDDGVALDLTGYTARFQISESVDAEGALILVTPTSGDPNAVMFITAGAGQILVSLASNVTQDLPIADTAKLGAQALGVWSLEITSDVGVVSRLLEGAVTISARVVLA